MAGDILVLAEHRNGEVDGITFQLLSKGRELADKLGVQLKVLILGVKLEALIKTLVGEGADVVLVADHHLLEPYNPEIYCQVVCGVVKNTKPSLFLLGYTFLGMEIGPAIAIRLEVILASNCLGLELADRIVTVTRPIFCGVAHTKVELQGPRPYIVSFQKGKLPTKHVSGRAASVLAVPVQIDERAVRTKVIDTVEASTGEIDITKADIIVAVGRGIREKANVQLAKDMAEAIGGVVACSRPVADFGWLPIECQVGLSGKTVKPKVYMACGISGASHHIAGMADSQLIIAINEDRSAPIFQVAHYGVIGDLFEIIAHITLR